jgi:sugar phosphate isomerase/epimerase
MRVTTGAGRQALLTYCANVHPGESLGHVLDALGRFAGPVRRALGRGAMGIGLWLSRPALTELRASGVEVLRDALDAQGLFVFTMNGFPYGNFHAPVVKRRVYHPDLGTDERRAYLLELAEVLAALMPPDVSAGTISTLPLAHRGEAEVDTERRACSQLGSLATDLARLAHRTGKSIRVCLEPEPGCLLETTDEAVRFFAERLPAFARDAGADATAVGEHLGLCFDTCHQAVAFEDARASLDALRAAGVAVGKVQLSSALEIPNPADAAAREALERFHEPRFLHQARARLDSGALAMADDLDELDALPPDGPWRVHFHVPIHREELGPVRTTRPFLRDTLAHLRAWDPIPHLEVETYTWSVLPHEDRPEGDAGLVRGIAAELRWAMEELS